MHDQDGAGARRDRGLQRAHVEGPAVLRIGVGVVLEWVLAKDNIVELRDEVKERIAGASGQQLITGVAEQTEEIAVGLACTGGETDVAGLDHSSVVAIVERNRLARSGHAEGLRRIAQGCRIGKRCQQRGCVVMEAALRGVGDRQVEQRQSGDAALPCLRGQLVLGQVPSGALGEVHDCCHGTAWTDRINVHDQDQCCALRLRYGTQRAA